MLYARLSVTKEESVSIARQLLSCRRYAEARGWEVVGEFIDDVERFLKRWLPRFDPSERSYLTVAVGCTGGRHRSVYIAERLQERFRALGGEVLCFHRELA